MGVKMNKTGYYFSIDAIIAAVLLFTGLIFARTLYVQEEDTTSIQHYSQDAMNILSSVKLYELNSSVVSAFVSAGLITDLNKTFLEQAGQFWAEGNTSLADALLNVTSDVVQSRFKIGVFFDNEFVYGTNQTPSGSVVSSKQLLSGITKGKPVEGFTSEAQLTGFNAWSGFSYAYFGGFIGQGNLTIRVVLPDSFANITSAYLELDPSDNFTLYINGAYSGNYSKGLAGGGVMLADKWSLNSSYYENFVPGVNYVNVTFEASSGYVGGGFLRVGYVTSELNDSKVKFSDGVASDRYYFPGVNGLINIYDSLYVPGALSTLTARLHYNSSFNTFLTIGNITVFSLNSTGVQEVDLANDDLDSKLDYGALSSTTVPIRLGSGTGNSTIFRIGNADVVLANDLSGSMEWCVKNDCSTSVLGPRRYCGTSANYRPEVGTYCNWTTENYALPNGSMVCSSRWHGLCPANDTRKIDVAVDASKQFTSVLLDSIGNKMGIVGYTNGWGYVIPANGSWTDRFAQFPDSIVAVENLTANATKITSYVDNYMDAYWGTCICCGVERATQMIINFSSADRYKSIVVMSDGEATDKCIGIGMGNAKQDAIEAARRACTNYNISVSTVAFGTDADAATLQAMACNNGTFYNASNLADLIAVYENIANNINEVSYKEQEINFSGALPAVGLLFGDSYMEYNYTPDVVPLFGVIPATLETPRFGNNISDTTFTLTSGTELNELKVTSYSSDKWTDNLTISNSVPLRQGFSLQQFGNDYRLLGDPFVVYAKSSLFEAGNNLVHISTGTAPGNYTGGSKDDKIIYTVLIKSSVGIGEVFSKADGCLWHVTFEDGTSTTLAVPPSYSGSEDCFFSPPSYTADDATDDAIFRLLSLLDFDGDGLLDVKFAQNDLEITQSLLSKVPSLWGPAIAEVRVWK